MKNFLQWVLLLALPVCALAADGGATGMTGAGGRRDGENSGRSRVAERARSGMPQRGLPRGAAGAGAGVAAVAGQSAADAALGALAAGGSSSAAVSGPPTRSTACEGCAAATTARAKRLKRALLIALAATVRSLP